MTERVIPKRLANVLLMFLCTIAFTYLLCLRHNFLVDESLCVIFIDLTFFGLFLMGLEHNRIHGKIRGNAATSYRKITVVYAALCVYAIALDFMPSFTKPVIVIPILMAVFASDRIALVAGMYFSAMLCFFGNASIYEMLTYLFMVMFGCMLADFMKEKKYRIWISMILFAISVMVPAVLDYFYNRELNIRVLAFGIGSGILLQFVLLFLYRRPELEQETDIPGMLDAMIKEDYPLAKEIRQFSKSEYNHAIRVSNISYRCALRIGADEKIAAAAGFYYRLGKLEGEPVVKNGVKLAENYFFPEKVVQILREYGGEEELPSSLESAIVHMVDAVVKKLEVLDKQTIESEWNQDMVVYQTLNELSSQGVYDKAGMSMNLFLKLREQLVKEEGLL